MHLNRSAKHHHIPHPRFSDHVYLTPTFLERMILMLMAGVDWIIVYTLLN